MKIGIIGLGDIAQKAYLPVITQWPGIELAFCTRNPAVLKQLAQTHRIPDAVTDYRELAGLGVDGVMIHSATSSHFEIAQFFLNHGIAVFVDKPLSDTYAACESLHNLAEAKQLPLFMGFNRRYLPLIQPHLKTPQKGQLMGIRWQKHRLNQPGDVRTFVFDDFIHPLDSVNLSGSVRSEDLHVITQYHQGKLARLDVEWQVDQTIYQASMNRLNGVTAEQVTLNFENRTVHFDSLATGTSWIDGAESKLTLPDWTPMLESKGFTAMIAHWLDVVALGRMEHALVQRNLNSHYLAEVVCQKLEQ
ncbi:Gfo/Idh/MocA family protein [Photobacterium galatheae]|uniref:Oxidoreductase n=1 Tax=Photobacterium galatheae TaxID=1654360 RepID=A0A066RLZ1_9GAMM|nr:Gfo/Idh/MocA family oxidoreductase [Photobacterium galatheae]KDM91470.1 oxidoreductase [Photobacterium galatheae]MCM0149542.1 Gfo/Idh/MocA family oxidoreductase [Photobacterium galatheae]